MDIDKFNLFEDARRFYAYHGFGYIETPWIVDWDIIEMTLPEGSNPHAVCFLDKQRRLV